MAEYIFGANILENLTTGMYKNSQVIFREYIQNACDAIDAAISQNILAAGEGRIDIWIEPSENKISIEDNGTGISEKNFETTLKSVAQSSKQLDIEKGFRGIGRLCGLAYCRELIFSATAAGENVISIMRIDAQKLRSKFYGKVKYTAQEVLDEVITFEKDFCDKSEHWFKVELLDINAENEILLNESLIKEYLSFVAPVEYQNYFSYSSKIYKHAAALNFKIDEYQIFVNGEQIVKDYRTHFKTRMGEDDIFDVAFKDFYDDAGNLIAWLWIGLSRFKGVLSEKTDTPSHKMRGIRLRKGNIQIGKSDALRNLFSERRGTNYFIGEVFAVDKNLIPNAQRDYFIENPELKNFEKALKIYFEELHNLYYQASHWNSNVRAVKSYNELKNQTFNTPKQKEEAELKLVTLKEKAEKAEQEIEKFQKENLPDSPIILSRIIFKIINKAEKISVGANTTDNNTPENPFPNLNRSERKLVSKILDTIRENVDGKTFENLQEKIIKAVNAK